MPNVHPAQPVWDQCFQRWWAAEIRGNRIKDHIIFSSSVCLVSVKGNGLTVSDEDPLWATAFAFKVTFHVRDRRRCNRVGLTFGIRPMLAGTQTSFLIWCFNVGSNFHFRGPMFFLRALASCETSPLHQGHMWSPREAPCAFREGYFGSRNEFLEHRVHVNSPSISSCSRGLCIYLGVSGLDLQPGEPLAPALSKFKTLTFTQHPGHFPR